MEYFRFYNCGPFLGWGSVWGYWRLVNVEVLQASQGFQASQILEILKWHPYNYGKNLACLIKFDICVADYHFYFCCDGNATLWKRLLCKSLWNMGVWYAPVEFHGFFPQFYDCFSCIMWWMDRIHVGLYTSCRYDFFKAYSDVCLFVNFLIQRYHVVVTIELKKILHFICFLWVNNFKQGLFMCHRLKSCICIDFVFPKRWPGLVTRWKKT